MLIEVFNYNNRRRVTIETTSVASITKPEFKFTFYPLKTTSDIKMNDGRQIRISKKDYNKVIKDMKNLEKITTNKLVHKYLFIIVILGFVIAGLIINFLINK